MRELIAQARREWQTDGVFAADTYIQLNNAGINPDILFAQFETEGETE